MTQTIKAATILKVVGCQDRGKELCVVLHQQLNALEQNDRYCFHS